MLAQNVFMPKTDVKVFEWRVVLMPLLDK